MFQGGSGWFTLRAGAMVAASFIGTIAVKPATTPLIRRFGSRAILVFTSHVRTIWPECFVRSNLLWFLRRRLSRGNFKELCSNGGAWTVPDRPTAPMKRINRDSMTTSRVHVLTFCLSIDGGSPGDLELAQCETRHSKNAPTQPLDQALTPFSYWGAWRGVVLDQMPGLTTAFRFPRSSDRPLRPH
jgi:hypothetical protein